MLRQEGSGIPMVMVAVVMIEFGKCRQILSVFERNHENDLIVERKILDLVFNIR